MDELTEQRNLSVNLLTKIPARWHGQSRTSRVRVIVLHTTESKEIRYGARAVANYFKTTPRKASAHIVTDNKESIRCVDDNIVAWCAPGCNFDGLHLELVGSANQKKTGWQDAYSMAVINNAVKVAADWHELYNIPLVRLTIPQLVAGKSGFVGHGDVSQAYKLSDHFDPGPFFPWKLFLEKVKNELNTRKSQT